MALRPIVFEHVAFCDLQAPVTVSAATLAALSREQSLYSTMMLLLYAICEAKCRVQQEYPVVAVSTITSVVHKYSQVSNRAGILIQPAVQGFSTLTS